MRLLSAIALTFVVDFYALVDVQGVGLFFLMVMAWSAYIDYLTATGGTK